MDLGPYPVHGEADQAHSHVGIEALDGLHEADVAFLHQVADRQAIAHVAARDVHDEAQVREHQRVRSLEVLPIAETAGERELVLAAQHRDRRHALDISLEAAERAGEGEGGVRESESLACH